MIGYRLVISDMTDDARRRLMALVEAEYVDGEIRSYVLESARIPVGDSPRNPGHRWTERESS